MGHQHEPYSKILKKIKIGTLVKAKYYENIIEIVKHKICQENGKWTITLSPITRPELGHVIELTDMLQRYEIIPETDIAYILYGK